MPSFTLRSFRGCTVAALAVALTGAARSGRTSANAASNPAPSLGRLTATTSMSAARSAHTATLLPDGRVLVAGGFNNVDSATPSAELFDARTERFTALPRMTTLRHSHTATVLRDGKVLIVGGFGTGAHITTSAELFDPASQRFVATGPLRAARAGHTAVLLENGMVLIAGGVGPDWTFLASAELYDPTTGRFTPAGGMTTARESHTAVRLQDGRVLIAGGHRDRRANMTVYQSAETFDPRTGMFARVADMGVRRHKHDAVLLRDGRVLVTGGADERDFDGVYNSTELFDPRANTFTPGPRMLRGRYKHIGTSIVLPDGMVLIAGGAPEAETFDPRSNTFALVAGTARMGGQFAAAAPAGAGRVLVTGGYGNGAGPRASSWLYRP